MTSFSEKIQVVEQRKDESRRSIEGDIDEIVVASDGGRPDVNGVSN